MSDDKVMAKIKKCLALSLSNNPHEAAIALKQAQALMAQHAVTRDDIALSAVGERATTAGRRTHHPPGWLWQLVEVVETAFGVAAYYRTGHRRTAQCVFVGLSPALEIAEYTFAVLRRQCGQARQTFYHRIRGKRVNRIRRADTYAKGWALGVARQVETFAEPVPAIVSQYLATRVQLETHSVNTQTAHRDRRALLAGFVDGKTVQLHHGVNGTDQDRLEYAQ